MALLVGDAKVVAAVYGPKAGTKNNENAEKACFEVIWKPKTRQIGKIEKEYEMILERTIQRICVLTVNPNTTTSVIIQVVHDDGSISLGRRRTRAFTVDEPQVLVVFLLQISRCSPFWQEKYERDAKKYWDIFYGHHGDRMVYRGPKSSSSTFRNWHSVSIRSIKVDKDGETIAYIKNSHGDNMGLRGYVKVSLDVMLVELNTRGKPSFKSPSSLFRQFYYGDVRFEYQKKVVEYHVEGELTVNLAYLIYEGIYHNTSGHVYENEGGSKEIIGSPIDRALFKWAIQSEEDMGRVYNKADSTTIKGCSSNSMPRYSSVAVNCEIAGTRGVRIHWKGKASVILDKCTGILENNEYRKMTTSKKSQLKEAINRMAAQKLICIALAFKNSDSTCVPPHDRLNLWKFPFENLILLAEDDEIRAPIDFHENRNEEELRDSVWWDDGEICIAPESDSEVSDVPEDIKPHQWLDFYDIGLCGRLGLYCYNFQKGTDYEFKCVRNCYTEFGSLITLEAMNPANSSPLTFEMLVKHDDLTEGVQSWWETCICRVEGSKEADHEWDNEAIDDRYKGEMPKWLSDDDLQHCYVVKDSELMETKNWWLLLFSEFAFYTKWPGTLRPRDAVECLPLETQKVVVETQGKAETEPREKLKAANAIFYISFECGNDPVTGKVANYRAVVRKTMDGKPGHMRLEVRCWSI